VAALDVLAGRPVDMKRAWRFALRPGVWGTLLLAFVAIVGSFFVCVLPMFYVAPLLAFTLPVMAEEGVFGFPALARSAALATHNPGGRWVSGKEDPQGVMARWIWFQVPAQFLSSLVRTAIYLYTAFGIGLLFNDVRGRKEGVDLRSEIDVLFPAPPAGAPWP
jgi:hypothetical protein